MVRHVGARTMNGVVLLESAQELAEPGIDCTEGMARGALHVPGDEIKKSVDRAALDGEGAVHIGFAGIEARVEEQFAVERPIMKANGDLGSRRTGKHMLPTIGIDDAQRADGDEVAEKMRQQHWVLSGSLNR